MCEGDPTSSRGCRTTRGTDADFAPQLRDALTRGCLIFDSWERIGDRANDASRVAGSDREGGDIFGNDGAGTENNADF